MESKLTGRVGSSPSLSSTRGESASVSAWRLLKATAGRPSLHLACFTAVGGAFLLATPHVVKGDTLALYGFENTGNSVPTTTNASGGIIAGSVTETPATPSPIFGADSGIYASTSTAFSLHSNMSTYTSPAGNGSLHSFSANAFVVGDFFQFNTSSAGYSGLTVSYDETGSNTGPGNFNFQYSTDGTTFTTVAASYNTSAPAAPYTIKNVSFNTVNASSGAHVTVDLSAISALANLGAVEFRITDASTTSIVGATVASGGTDRVDNFDLEGTAISAPEPTSLLLLGATLVPLTVGGRRRGRPELLPGPDLS